MLERSLVLIKPDAVERNLVGEIINVYEKAGLKIIEMKMEHVTLEKAQKHYIEHDGKAYFQELTDYLTRSPLVAIVFEGEDAIEKIRALNGSAKDPKPGTLREKYQISLTESSVHSSDSVETAKREIKLWFGK